MVLHEVAQFAGHLYHVTRSRAVMCVGRKMNVEDERATTDEPLIEPCINVTVCTVSYLSVKTVSSLLHPCHRDSGRL